MIKAKLFSACMAMSAMLLGACGPASSGPTSLPSEETLASISIRSEGGKTEVAVGATLQLYVDTEPKGLDNGAAWSSRDEKIAAVSDGGLVTGIARGNTIIKAVSTLDDKVSAEFALAVVPAPLPDPESVTVNDPTGGNEVTLGETLQLTATLLPAEADQTLVWSSDHEEIATVSENGLVRGMALGTAVITAASAVKPEIKGTLEITVVEANIPVTQDWPAMPFATHAEFMSAAKGTPLKIKGKITKRLADYIDKDGDTMTGYYIQNGEEGFYVMAKIAAMNVGEGTACEVGGYARNHYDGVYAIENVEYLAEIDEFFETPTYDLDGAADWTFATLSSRVGSLISLMGADIVDIAESFSTDDNQYKFTVEKGGRSIEVYVDPNRTGPEEYAAIGEKLSTLSPTQIVSFASHLTSYGYGKPLPEIDLTAAAEITAEPLDDQSMVDLAANVIAIQDTFDIEEVTIDLPTENHKFPGVVISWASDDTDVIDVTNNTVTHGEYDAIVHLTATIAKNEASAAREFEVLVIALNDDHYATVATLDFEDAESGNGYGCSKTKPGYQGKENDDVYLGGHNWTLLSALIGGDERDKRFGDFAARVQTKYDNGIISLDPGLKFDVVEFYVAIYGNNKLGTRLTISYKVDDETEFTQLGGYHVIDNYALKKMRFHLPVEEGADVYVKISALTGYGQRIDVDNIRLLKEGA